TCRVTSSAFAAYASAVGPRLGDRVGTWTTLNEPWCSAYLGYASGAHAPGRHDPAAALSAVHQLNLAHGLGLQALRSSVSGNPDYSVTLNLHAVRGEGEGGPEAVRQIEGLASRGFQQAMLERRFVSDVLEDTGATTDCSFVRDGDPAQINQGLDVLGVNHSSSQRVAMGDGVSLRHQADGH